MSGAAAYREYAKSQRERQATIKPMGHSLGWKHIKRDTNTMKSGPVMNASPRRGPPTSAFDSAEAGDLARVKALLREQPGALLALRNRNAASLLHEAAYFGQQEVGLALLQAKACLNMQEAIYGDTPLHTAASKARLNSPPTPGS